MIPSDVFLRILHRYEFDWGDGTRVVPQSRMIGYNIREAHTFTQAGTQYVKVSVTPSLRQAHNM